MIPATRRRLALSAVLLTTLALLSGCAGSGMAPSRPALDLDRGEAGSELRVLLSASPAASSFPFPRDAGEALVFAQFYETLTELGPDGRARPLLASSWKSDPEGRVWTFTLRNPARFWNGRSMEAADVAAAWQWTRKQASRRGLALPLDLTRPALKLRFPEPRTLVVELAEPRLDLPELLAAPCFAVSAGGRRFHWRLGTGPCRPESFIRESVVGLSCLPHDGHPRPARWKRLEFGVKAADAMPMLGRPGADALLLEDPLVESYFRRRADLRIVEMSAELRYGLLLPLGDSLGASRWRPALEQDLTIGYLRHSAAEPLAQVDPGAWARLGAWRGSAVIRYDADDSLAGELANRIAALATLPGRRDFGRAEFPQLLARSLSTVELDRYLAAALAGERTDPLLLALWQGGARPAVTDGRYLPLARTRPGLALHEGVGGLELGGDGVLRLDQLGRLPAGSRP